MTISVTSNNTDKQKTLRVEVKLSLLWLIVMLNMIYADILAFVSAFITPGAIEQLMKGYSGTVELTQDLLLLSAIFVEIPIMMILLCRLLSRKISRWVNLIACLLSILFVVGGIEQEPFFIFLASIEVLVMLYIIWTVIKWKETAY